MKRLSVARAAGENSCPPMSGRPVSVTSVGTRNVIPSAMTMRLSCWRVVMSKKKSHIHTYAMLLLGDRKLSQTRLAELCSCDVSMINRILLGTKTSMAIEAKIASALGFRSWKELERESELFQQMFVSMHLSRKEA